VILYLTTASRLFRRCVERHPRLEIHFDKRYTSKFQSRMFERYLREEISDLSGTIVTVEQDDSVALKELQAADFVAWAAGQRTRGNDTFWQIIAHRVVLDEVIRREKW